MWPLTALALAMLLLGGFTPQRAGAAADVRTSETPHVKVTTSAGAAVGNKVTLFVDVAPKRRMHVYAPGQTGYLAVTLTVAPQPGIVPAAPRFPRPERVFFEQLDETQLVYSRPFRIVQDVTLTRESQDVTLTRESQDVTPTREPQDTIKGSLRYQACDDKVCYLPRTIAVEWRIGRKKV